MTFTRRKLIGLGGISLGAGALAGILLARASGGPRRPRRTQVASGDQMTLDLEDTKPVTRALVIRASATVARIPWDCRFCWYLEVRRWDSETGKYVVIDQREYDQQWFGLPAGRTAKPTFAERISPVPAGEYNVLVGLREERPRRRADGTLEPHISMVALSRVLTVR